MLIKGGAFYLRIMLDSENNENSENSENSVFCLAAHTLDHVPVTVIVLVFLFFIKEIPRREPAQKVPVHITCTGTNYFRLKESKKIKQIRHRI